MSSSLAIAQQMVGEASALLPWLRDPDINDILINGLGKVFVERFGKLEPRENPFNSASLLFELIERFLVPLGKRIDAAQPFIDGRLSDGSRFHIILPPLVSGGPHISIRKHRFQSEDFPSFGNPRVEDWLEEQVALRKNLLIVGGTGSGKTTLLCKLLRALPAEERVAVIEESTEIRFPHPHLIHLEARPATPDGVGGVSLSLLVRNVLRMRPDRIILGECRGEEAFDVLQAMNSGHGGSISTLHANSCLDGLRRFESLVLLGKSALPWKVVREWVALNVHLVVHTVRQNGQRRINEVIGVNGLEGEVFRIKPEFRAPQKI